MNIFLFFFLVNFLQVVEVLEQDDDNATLSNSDISLRFANINTVTRDETLIQLYFFQSLDGGIRVPLEDESFPKIDMDRNIKTYVLFNGHPSSDSMEPYEELKAALFEEEGRCNIFLVYADWTEHQINFIDAVALAESLGQFTGDALNRFDLQPEKLHFIGHCSGVDLAVATAHRMHQFSKKLVPRLTAFDPYITRHSNLYSANNYIDFVDVYHSGIYDPPFGPVGNVDFYPNAGVKQPGCDTESDSVLTKFVCHHRRSIYYYIESITTQVKAVEARFDRLSKNLKVIENPNLSVFGHWIDPAKFGTYYLPTRGETPFLMDYF